MKKNKKAISMIIAMWLVLVSTLIALMIFEYITPFSRSVVDMENSSKAYYYANSWLEEWLFKIKSLDDKASIRDLEKNEIPYFISVNNNQFEEESGEEDYKKNTKWYTYNVLYVSEKEPEELKWNSDEDNNYNKIYLWSPIQMDIWKIVDSEIWNDIKILFKINDWFIYNKSVLSTKDKNIISWQLSSEDWYINSTESNSIKWKDLWKEKTLDNLFTTDSKLIITNQQDPRNFSNFIDIYNALWCQQKACILKFSIMDDLILEEWNNWKILPYIEWKIESRIGLKFRKRYMEVNSVWKSYLYMRDLSVKVPQTTTNEAFNFTVFQ